MVQMTNYLFFVIDVPDITVSVDGITVNDVFNYKQGQSSTLNYNLDHYFIYPLYYHFGNPVYISNSNLGKVDVSSYLLKGYILLHSNHKSNTYTNRYKRLNRLITVRKFIRKWNAFIAKILDNQKRIKTINKYK